LLIAHNNIRIMKNLFAILFIALAMSSCSNKEKEEAAKQAAIAAVKDSIRLDSFKRADAENKAKLAELETKKAEEAKQAEEKRLMMLAEERSAASAPAVAAHNTSTTTTTTTQKKGWSSAAKGTAIGAGAGALGGALIDKKKGRGAIIGGVVGAGTGYIIGRDKDKKSGRVQ
jgi:flagellum-specific peptidoglycan hydrolase FlgJ